MSRSYKKHPVCVLKGDNKLQKRLANKRVRRYKHKIAKGKGYKKIFESWEIVEYSDYCSLTKWLNVYKKPKSEEEEEKLKKDWTKWFRRK